MKCTVVETPEHEATQRYTWAWGQTGATCDEHRAIVENQSTQLQRSVSWEPISEPTTDPGRRPYAAPTLRKLDPDSATSKAAAAEIANHAARLNAENRELNDKLKAANAEMAGLRVRNMQLEAELAERPRESVIEGAPKP